MVYMLIRTCSLVILIFSGLTAAADLGSGHCLEMTIALPDGSVTRVYYTSYDLTLDRDEEGYYYRDSGKVMRLRSPSSAAHWIDIASTDYHFSHFVKRTLPDTIWVFDDAVAVLSPPHRQEKNLFMAYVNPGRRIASKNIRDLVVHRAYAVVPGQSIDTPLTSGDVSWLRKATIVTTQSLEGGGNCSYHVLFFRESNEQVQLLLRQLQLLYNKETQSLQEYQEIQAILKKLREAKVLIASSCSC
ncbi:MAG TPA: hypothetical protein VGK59_21885 [Ohtaekwangia sp.]